MLFQFGNWPGRNERSEMSKKMKKTAKQFTVVVLDVEESPVTLHSIVGVFNSREEAIVAAREVGLGLAAKVNKSSSDEFDGDLCVVYDENKEGGVVWSNFDDCPIYQLEIEEIQAIETKATVQG